MASRLSSYQKRQDLLIESAALLDARLRSADLTCHACDDEGLGEVLIEIMAVGLPVLASNVPPLHSLLEDGVNGFLIDNEPAARAKRIEEHFGAVAARKQASRNAIEFHRRVGQPFARA